VTPRTKKLIGGSASAVPDAPDAKRAAAIGFVGGTNLIEALGVHPARRRAFFRRLQAHAAGGKVPQTKRGARKKPRSLLESAPSCATPQTPGMEAAGIELLASFTGNTTLCPQDGAVSGALGIKVAQVDLGLVAVIQAWPRLPEAIRVGSWRWSGRPIEGRIRLPIPQSPHASACIFLAIPALAF
jgi:hypothetical protein